MTRVDKYVCDQCDKTAEALATWITILNLSLWSAVIDARPLDVGKQYDLCSLDCAIAFLEAKKAEITP